jgi:uncharacterized protein
MIPIYTSLIAGVLTLLQVPLTVFVGYYRQKSGIFFSHGDNQTLLLRMRAHGNYIETVPICLIAIGLAEMSGAPGWLLLAGGALLIVGRLFHFVGVVRTGQGMGRAIGMIATLSVMVVFGVYGVGVFLAAGVN